MTRQLIVFLVDLSAWFACFWIRHWIIFIIFCVLHSPIIHVMWWCWDLKLSRFRKPFIEFIVSFCFCWWFLMILSVDLYSGWHRLTSNLSGSFHLRMPQAKVSRCILEVLHLYMITWLFKVVSNLYYTTCVVYVLWSNAWNMMIPRLHLPWSTCKRLDWQNPSLSDRPSHRAAPLQQRWDISQAWHRYPAYHRQTGFCNVILVPFRLHTQKRTNKLRQLCASSIIMLHLAFLGLWYRDRIKHAYSDSIRSVYCGFWYDKSFQIA